MRIISLIVSLIAFANGGQAQRVSAPALIPAPVEASWQSAIFTLTANTGVTADEVLMPAVALLEQYAGIRLRHGSAATHIRLRTDTLAVKEPEGYRLSINQTQIDITVHDGAAAFRAVQTLRQLWRPSGPGRFTLQGSTIMDYPRFAYRGMHLDVSRHFFSVAYVKAFIDKLALYKFNNFHWHLTDDQGWRIEIKKYPALQSVSAWRNETLAGHKKELPHRFDGKRYGGFYTQEEVKEVVDYATARGINVVPEIEMPGHALAALAAYPHLGCTGGPYKTATFWGVFDDVFCAGKDSTFTFLQDVLDEVMALFPSHYIHIGGDECPKTRWNVCPACSGRMRREGLKDGDALQAYFINRITQYVRGKGRNIIGWDEILEGGLAPGATVMSWRGTEGAMEAARQRHRLIMTPEDELYFDHYPSLYAEEPVAAGGYTPLREVYEYEPPVPAIAGLQGQVWSEYLNSPARADQMIYPRMMALAEVAWSQKKSRDFKDFSRRMKPYTVTEISYRIDTVLRGRVVVSLHTAGTGTIRYALDGKNFQPYRKPIDITTSAELTAKLYLGDTVTGGMFRQAFHIHAATGASVTLTQTANTRFAGPPVLLVNGVAGTARYNTGQWLGFSGRDLEAVIDLGSVKTIRQLGANVLNYHWQRMWEPSALQFYVSGNGVDYRLAAEQKHFPVNGINTTRLSIPPVQARFVKVKALHKGVIPPGEYGAGGNSMLLVDELIVE